MEQQEQPTPKFLYNTINEVIEEWQNSEHECSLWDHLGLSESVFKAWMSKCRAGVFEN